MTDLDTTYSPEYAVFGEFNLFKLLDEDELLVLSSNSELVDFAPKKMLFRKGSNDSHVLFLRRGKVQMTADDGKAYVVEGGSERAQKPLSIMQPHRYDAITLTEVECLSVERTLLGGLMTRLQNQGGDIVVDEHASLTNQDDHSGEHPLLTKIFDDIRTKKLEVPSLPEVAMRVERMLGQEDTDFRTLAEAMIADPAIVARIIKVANSPLYRGAKSITSCSEAIQRLGILATRNLVMTFAVHDLLGRKMRYANLQKLIDQLRHRSTEVAAISYVLADKVKNLGFEPEQALLAGLFHDIGMMPLISYADHYPDLVKGEEDIGRILRPLSPQVSLALLQQWGVAEDLWDVAREAKRWKRKGGGTADYCDLVIAAQIHSFIGTPKMDKLPGFDQIPAMTKLGFDKLSPEVSLDIMAEAKDKLAHLKAMFGR